MRKATIVIKTEHGQSLVSALAPEVARPLPRTKVSLRTVGEELHIDVEAKDTSALRAALNSYIRWTSIAMRMIEEAQA